MNFPGHAFISYVNEDWASVDQLQRILQRAGIRVWRNTTDLRPGEDWQQTIQRAINDDALVFLACFSRHRIAQRKSHQNEELALAISQLRLRGTSEPWLIPIRFDDCVIPDIDIGSGKTLRSIQSIDLVGHRFDEEAARLAAVIQHALQRDDHAEESISASAPTPESSDQRGTGDERRITIHFDSQPGSSARQFGYIENYNERDV